MLGPGRAPGSAYRTPSLDAVGKFLITQISTSITTDKEGCAIGPKQYEPKE